MENKRLLILHQMWTAGASAEDIGRRFGVSAFTIYDWVRRYKIPPRNVRDSELETPTPEEIAERARECRERHFAQRRAETEDTTQSKTSYWNRGIRHPR